MVRGSLKQRLMLDLQAALGSSLDLRSVLDAAFPILTRLIPVDCGALCVSNPASAGGYDWATIDFPFDWFSAYADMAPHDFVRRSVLARPNVVLRDSEMISRTDLEKNMMYQRAREVGVPLEQVMSVMLDPSTTWHAGITLYRARRRPFLDTQQALLQQIAPLLGNAVRNCKLLAEQSRRGDVLESILGSKNVECVIMSAKMTPEDRTAGVASLIARWFEPVELDRFGTPHELVEKLQGIARGRARGAAQPLIWTRPTSLDVMLRVEFAPIPDRTHQITWAITFQETSTVPKSWKHVLTRAEFKVALRAVLGWDNQLIGDDVGCSRNTVKKHLSHIFDKLGVSSRTALCRIASQRG